tara:strand:- start:1308 stop:2288 length:981 start_codon:yes stop_codon:yes gene_type:complete
MKIAFLTEMRFEGIIPSTHPNMRTEFAWMHALNANHFHIDNFLNVKKYDHVFVVIPKGKLNLSAEGTKIGNQINPASSLLSSNLIKELKKTNSKVHYIQEGPSWWFNDYEIIDQFNFYNSLAECDSIFAHNEHDIKFYKGLFPEKIINIMPTLLIEDLTKNIIPKSEDKVIIGGNFARWYGGFQSYIVADEFGVNKWTQESHAKRENENSIDDLNHLPRMQWIEWMNTLSTFKYAIHLMPTIAAGTFSLNCAYFGIPCIGNEKVDTQRMCHPDLSVDIDDVEKARKLAKQLKEDKEWYRHCSKMAKFNYSQFYNIKIYKEHLNNIL